MKSKDQNGHFAVSWSRFLEYEQEYPAEVARRVKQISIFNLISILD